MKMAYDLGTSPLFAAAGGQPPSLASLWPTAVSTSNALNIASPYGGLGVGLPPPLTAHPALPALYGAPPSVLESLAPPPPPKPEQVISGFGKLTWLSSKAGLITCANNRVISFQIKDFCDNQLTDLTSVLRVGFTLSFQAAMSESNEYIATLVSPLYGQDSEKVFANSPEANLDEVAPSAQPGNNKDAYSLRIEERAIPTLLAIFQRHAVPQIQLSSLHSQMSSVSGSDDELFRYVGSSSLKRRQFIERRTHIFCLSSDDTITLQQPSIYSCVLRLASHLLRRGGVTAIESLYEFYMSPNMPHDIRLFVGESRGRFIELMQNHPWIFSIFPNRTYVSVRRNLPHYDYPEFVRATFAECDLFRAAFPARTPLPSAYSTSSAAPAGTARGGPAALSRTLSQTAAATAGPPLSGLGRHPSVSTPTGAAPGATRPHSLWPEAEVTVSGGDWFSGGPGWRPQPLLSSLSSGAVKGNNSVATQTEADSALVCVCSCNCGARQNSSVGASRTSFSATPPSGASVSHTPPMASSPMNGIRLPNFEPPRYYDPFGFDLNSPNLAALNLNL